MKTVFILGAGASAEAGAPLMGNFLAKAKQLYDRGVFGESSARIRDVLDAAYKDLKPVQAKSSIEFWNIEEVFSAIDIGAMLELFGSRDPSTLSELKRSIRVFIYRTLEESIRLPARGLHVAPPEAYAMLARLVLQKLRLHARRGRVDVSFITFNYDACLEFALVRSALGVDYALPEAFIEGDESRHWIRVPVLKLHGSINRGTCSKCQAIVPTEIDPWRCAAMLDLEDRPATFPLLLGSQIARRRHSCGALLDEVPFLVPPTWDKSTGSAALRSVWRRAATELGSADRIVVIGYSLPESDRFFKHLYALGTNSDVHLEKLVVVNGVNGQETAPKFRAWLGPMSKDGFEFCPLVFSQAERVIADVLNE
jgi:NAD-dependent SIR2 family protein deacetylase